MKSVSEKIWTPFIYELKSIDTINQLTKQFGILNYFFLKCSDGFPIHQKLWTLKNYKSHVMMALNLVDMNRFSQIGISQIRPQTLITFKTIMQLFIQDVKNKIIGYRYFIITGNDIWSKRRYYNWIN